jgi:hypothetical protein
MQTSSNCSLTIEETPDAGIVEHFRNALSEFNRAHAGHDHHKDLLIDLRDASNKIVGGLVGGT